MTRGGGEIERGADDNEGEVPSPEAGGPRPRQLTAPRTRKMLTGVELEARFSAWRGERHTRRTERTPEDRARTLRRAVGSAMGAAIVALVVAMAVTSHGFEAMESANATRITSLQSRVAEVQAATTDAHLQDKMTKLVEAAAANAGKVRDAQQAYAALYRQASIQPGADNGAPNGAMLATAEHGRVLAPLFDRKSYLVDDKGAYTWQNVVPFDTNSKIDPRFAWYVRYDGRAASDPSTYTWKVETVMPDLDAQDASGAASKAKVVWLCREAQIGDVLAWASATYTYSRQHGAFDDLDVVVTAAGAKHENPVSTSRNGSDIPELSGPAAATTDPKVGTR